MWLQKAQTRRPDTGNHMPVIMGTGRGRGGACVFIKMTVRRHLPPSTFGVVNWSFKTNKQKENPLNDIWLWWSLKLLWVLKGDRRSMCVFTQITKAFTATRRQQTEISCSSSIRMACSCLTLSHWVKHRFQPQRCLGHCLVFIDLLWVFPHSR